MLHAEKNPSRRICNGSFNFRRATIQGRTDEEHVQQQARSLSQTRPIPELLAASARLAFGCALLPICFLRERLHTPFACFLLPRTRNPQKEGAEVFAGTLYVKLSNVGVRQGRKLRVRCETGRD